MGKCDDADTTLQTETDLFEKGQPVIFRPCCTWCSKVPFIQRTF